MTMRDEIEKQKLEIEAKRRGTTPMVLEMSRAVDDRLLRDLVRDGRRHSPVASCGMLPEPRTSVTQSRPQVGKGGWIDPPAVRDWRAPGLAVMDRMMDQQDALDRAERAQRFNRLPLNGGK